MKTSTILPLVLLALCLSFAGKNDDEMDPPKISLSYSTGPLKKGSSLTVQIEIEDGWHINSTNPADEYLFPLKLSASAPGILFDKAVFPEPDEIFEEALQANNSVYHGTIKIVFPIKQISETVDSLKTEAQLSYQACSNKICLMPTSIKIFLNNLFQESPSLGEIRDVKALSN